MATKSTAKKPTKKTAAKKPVAAKKSKAPDNDRQFALDSAYNGGATSFETGGKLTDNPHLNGDQELAEAWKTGWIENEHVENEEAEVDAAENADQAEPAQPQLANGHNLNDPEVLAANQRLETLLQAFDNCGVQLVEEQWRAFSEEEQSVACAWANARRIGEKRPVPQFLIKYSAEWLVQEISPYFEKQAEGRKVIMPCHFGKPSSVKPDNDASDFKISMTLSVPVAELSPGTANDLFGYKKSKVEFTLRNTQSWNATHLPETDEVINVTADISGFSRNRKHWKFSFLVPESLLSIKEACHEFWGNSGSCRVEVVGEITQSSKRHDEAEERGEAEPTVSDDPGAKAKAPSLFSPDTEDDHDLDDEGVFLDPGMCWFIDSETIDGREIDCCLYIAKHDGKFFTVGLLEDLTDKNDRKEIGSLHVRKNSRNAATLNAVLEAELGSLIDRATADSWSVEVINRLKDYFKKLSDPAFEPEVQW